MHKEEVPYSPHRSDPIQIVAQDCKSLGSLTGYPLFDYLHQPRVKMRSSKFANVIMNAPEKPGRPNSYDNIRIDAGWTYFGQFLAHDLTVRRDLKDAKPRLNLECLYGFGPRSSGYLYEMSPDREQGHGYKFRAIRFVFNGYRNKDNQEWVDDVFRIGADIPIMADVRNDDNFLLSQLHCAIMRFHNSMAEYFHKKYPEEEGDILFRRTRKFVTWTYQWLIVNEYLPLLTGDVADGLVTKGHPYKILAEIDKPDQGATLIPEFVVAALRIGHSQVRSFYQLNGKDKDTRGLPIYTSIKDNKDLRGFARNTSRGPVDWSFFFASGDQQNLQKSRPMDLQIASPLGRLPFLRPGHQNLAKLNIIRSVNTNMIIREADLSALHDNLGIDTIWKFKDALDELYTDYAGWPAWDNCKKALLKLDGWPLWVFILLEARIKGADSKNALQNICQQLGPLGAQIIAEQIVWVLKKDSDSYLCSEAGADWNPMEELRGNYSALVTNPSICAPTPVLFSIADLLHIAKNGVHFSPSK